MIVLVLGAGASGQSAKAFLESRGHDVTMYDDDANGLVLPQISACSFDMCVISPGVSIHHPLAKKFKDRLISELDLGFSIRRKKSAKTVAVTGTNGKTTVVNMINKALGNKGVLCGNVGIPVTSVTEELETKIAVTEVSSFQLEVEPRYFKPDISVILNVTQDHLDRHGTMEEYIACKSRISGKVNVLNKDCPIVSQLNLPNTVWFSGASHTEQNINAVLKVCELLGVDKETALQACNDTKIPHRIEFVTKHGSTEFYNDSKATNIGSTLAACRSFDKPVHLILGGVGKGQNFYELFEKLPANVKSVFVMGESSDQIAEAAEEKGYKTITACNDLPDAVTRAMKVGDYDKIVLLSPACASFDMFKNYADRGEQFKKIVTNL